MSNRWCHLHLLSKLGNISVSGGSDHPNLCMVAFAHRLQHGWAWEALPSHSITVSELYLTYHQVVVQDLFATNYIKSSNERIHSSIFSLLCHLHLSGNPLFVNYFHTDIHILEALFTQTGDPNCTHYICIVFFTLFLIIILITYSIFSWPIYLLLCTHLFSLLLVPHKCFNCILCIVIFHFSKLYFL